MTEFERLKALLPIAVTRGDLDKLLRALLSEDDPWEWFRRARIPFPSAVAILRALRDGEFLEFGPTRFTGRGEILVSELQVRPAHDFGCATCGGSGIEWRGLEGVYSQYMELFQARPRGEDPALDQGAMTPLSLFRRIAFMIQEGDVAGREVVALGDDDLASLALALTGLPAGVTVFELDTNICEYIAETARDRGLDIRVIQQDLARFLPNEQLGTFDTFMCDPPETEAGLLLFVEKGLALLKHGDAHAGYFGATAIEASLAKWRRWQTRLLGNHEIAFTHILPPFTVYEPWPDERPLLDLPPLAQLSNHPWYRFAFYRLETIPGFEPSNDYEVEHSDIFYFDEESYYKAFHES
jgi:predicted methyltransferase